MIWDWVIGSIPPWVWIVGAVIVAALIISVLRQGGWKWALGAVAAGAAAYLQAKAYHRGVDVERAKQVAADKKAQNTIAREREEHRAMPEDQLDREIDRWTRQ